MNVGDVERRLHGWADAKALPSVCVEKWLALDELSRQRLVEVVEKLNMRTGQFLTLFGLLEEISIRESKTVSEILDQPSLRQMLNSTGSGPGRARVMVDELRTLRYPRLKRAGERLAELVDAMKLLPGIKVVLPRDLSSDAVRVEIVAHGSVEMERALTCLTAKSGELVQLAAMLSGVGGPDRE